jgi:hypothetical protein
MNTYFYNGDIYCEPCGEGIRDLLSVPEYDSFDPGDERTWDSSEWPKGPEGDGGGEADTPQHCGQCNLFLANPLTSDGYSYLITTIQHATIIGADIDVGVLFLWMSYYGSDGYRDTTVKDWVKLIQLGRFSIF